MSATSSQVLPTVGKRVFPPLYQSTGNVAADRLAFFHILERLKTQKRTGWVDHNVPGPERYSGVCGTVILGNLCSMTTDATLDVSKCVMMCLVHDLAEAQVGDIAPREGIPRAEKRHLEEEAMRNFVHEMLHDTTAAQYIMSLWKEYEEQQTDEARFVKDLDRFEMASQASEYETNHGMTTLQPFFDSSIPFIRHSEVKQWGEDLIAEREQSRSQLEVPPNEL